MDLDFNGVMDEEAQKVTVCGGRVAVSWDDVDGEVYSTGPGMRHWTWHCDAVIARDFAIDLAKLAQLSFELGASAEVDDSARSATIGKSDCESEPEPDRVICACPCGCRSEIDPPAFQGSWCLTCSEACLP